MNQKFTGQEHDSELGLDFFNARYFSAGLGRFTSPDPMNAGADPTGPQRWNGYSYVANNPLIFVDPSGKSILQFMSSVWNAISGWGSEKGSGNGGDYNPGFGIGVPLPVMNDRAPLVVRGGATFSVTKTAVADIATKNQPSHSVSSLLSKVTSAVLNKPWVLSWIIPITPEPVLAGIGPAGDLEWNPDTHTVCGGIGIGASAGRNAAVGPLTNGKMFNGNTYPNGADSLLSGWSASIGYNSPFFLGGQGMINGSGAAIGPSVGPTGFSVAATYSACVKF